MTQYIELEQAKIIVRRMNEPVNYIKGNGCRCPLCGAVAKVENVKINANNQHVRYCKCPECGYRFSAKSN